MKFVEYLGCPNCYKSFPKKEMKRVLHPNMNVYIYFCKNCFKDYKQALKVEERKDER